MNLKEQIFVRMSCRDYSDDEIDMDLIHDFMSGVRALDDSLNYDYEILNASANFTLKMRVLSFSSYHSTFRDWQSAAVGSEWHHPRKNLRVS